MGSNREPCWGWISMRCYRVPTGCWLAFLSWFRVNFLPFFYRSIYLSLQQIYWSSWRALADFGPATSQGKLLLLRYMKRVGRAECSPFPAGLLPFTAAAVQQSTPISWNGMFPSVLSTVLSWGCRIERYCLKMFASIATSYNSLCQMPKSSIYVVLPPLSV